MPHGTADAARYVWISPLNALEYVPHHSGERITSQVKAVFYLPIHDNDGRDLSAECEAVRRELFWQFDGWTHLGLVTGDFRMADNSEAIDVSRAYAVLLDESEISDLEGILTDFKSQTTQEAIYLEIQHNVDVRFL